jgi:hypothetical protein
MCQSSGTSATSSSAPTATDTHKPSHELHEKCARDAREWYKHAWKEGPAEPGLVSNYTNHYSAKLRGCFIVVNATFLYSDKSGKDAAAAVRQC